MWKEGGDTNCNKKGFDPPVHVKFIGSQYVPGLGLFFLKTSLEYTEQRGGVESYTLTPAVDGAAAFPEVFAFVKHVLSAK